MGFYSDTKKGYPYFWHMPSSMILTIQNKYHSDKTASALEASVEDVGGSDIVLHYVASRNTALSPPDTHLHDDPSPTSLNAHLKESKPHTEPKTLRNADAHHHQPPPPPTLPPQTRDGVEPPPDVAEVVVAGAEGPALF